MMPGWRRVLPTASTALTSKVWPPTATVGVYVLVQDAHAPPSRRHWNDVAPSEPTNAKVGVVSVLDAAGPEVIVVSGGVVSTVNPRLAGVASVFPCSSVARTSKVCAPSANAAVVVGDVHADHAPPSTRHSNVAPASEVNENVGVLSPVVPLGPAVIVVSGAVGSDVSTVKDRLAGVGSVRPTPSVARTSKTCAPSDSAPVVNGELQDANAAASTRHSKVAPASVAVKENVGVLSLVVPLGPAVMVVSGGVVSHRERPARR